MRVFVTGGTGAIGRYAVPALIAAGHSGSALARSDATAENLRRQGATPVRVLLFERNALTAAFTHHDAVVNLASALPSTTTFIFRSAWRECEQVRIKGSAAVVDAARSAGISRLVQESVVMIYADGGDDWINEDHPVDHYPITRGNHSAEANAHRFGDLGGRATVLRFGVFYGRGACKVFAFAVRSRPFGLPIALRDTVQVTWRYDVSPSTAGGADVTESFELQDVPAMRLYWRTLGWVRGPRMRRDMERTLRAIKMAVE